ncbi:LamG domain-containing protein [Verrucomicrobia bacterium]|nr:LamG domain-containing protein [Verrucomicrobiota bacterium]
MKRITLVLAALFSLPAFAGKWDEMNYGPFLTTSLEVRGAGIVNKAIAIRLDAGEGGVSKGDAFMLYDTDLMNCAAGWSGGFIDWRGIAFDGRHGAHASIRGDQTFANLVGPGWRDSAGKWEDNVRVRGLDKKPYGPLPRDWAHYKGLYVQGNKVVLSYTVGSRGVFEMPSLHGKNIFIRNLHVAPGTKEIVMQIARGTGAQHLDGSSHIVLVKSAGSIAAVNPSGQFDFGAGDTTISAWIKTKTGGTIISKAAQSGSWVKNGKTFFVRGGKLGYDVGWVGQVSGGPKVNDGKWHHVAASRTRSGRMTLYVDGKQAVSSTLASGDDASHIVRLGYTATDFMPAFKGEMDEMQIFKRVLSGKELTALAEGKGPDDAAVSWNFDGVKGGKIRNTKGSSYEGTNQGAKLVEGKNGKALQFSGNAQVLIAGKAKGAKRSAVINPNANEPVIAAAVLGDTGLWNLKNEENLRLRIPASTKAQKLRVLIWSGKRGEVADFSKAVAAVKVENEAPNLMKLTEGGKAKWTETVETQIQSGLATGPYATDTFILPNENPWKSWMRLGGFDFFKDNRRAAVCTWQGDVWIVEGLDLPKGKITWRRIAAGMFQPLGLKIVDETIYVCCRDQITRLHDTNDDGEIDFYENFNNDHQVTEHFHEFAMDLQTDDEGNFYFSKAARHAKDGLVPHHGSIIKISKDGSKSWRIANGFRAPNGVTVNGDGTFFASDQEGHWTPKNRINLIKQDGFYGYMGSYVPGRDPEDYDPPVVWIHNSVDRSPAQQLWVTSDKWGPLKGSLINLSYGTGRLFTVPYEMVDGVPQGGLSRLPIGETPTGVMRGRFHPVDGQLYACGLFGWAGNKSKSGGFYRFRYTGKALHIPVKYSVSKKGVSLTFSEALDKESAADPESYAAEMCNYRRTRGYGSRDYLVSNPDKQGRDKLEITKVTLGPDGRTVLLQMPKLQKCMTLRIQYNIKGAKGKTVKSEINCTVNVLK